MAEDLSVIRLLASVLSAWPDASLPERLCARARETLGMDAVAVTLLSLPDHRSVVYATDEQVMLVEDVQFTSGDGPVVEAFRHSRAVLVPDLQAEALSRWPLFGEASRHAPRYSGAFAFPLVADLAAPIGVMTMYSHGPRPLDAAGVAEAQTIAHAMTLAVLHMPQHPPEGLDEGTVPGTRDRLLAEWAGAEQVVFQAVGMVIAVLRIEPDEALARLRAHAFATGSTLDEIAMAVVERRLELEA